MSDFPSPSVQTNPFLSDLFQRSTNINNNNLGNFTDEDDAVFYEDEQETDENEECYFSGSDGNVAALLVNNNNNLATTSTAGATSNDDGNPTAMSKNGDSNEINNVVVVEVPPMQCWYHGRLDRKRAEHLMQGAAPGSYLIRESDRRPRCYVLTLVSSAGCVFHFRINAVCGHYFISQHEFSSLIDLVRYFSTNAVIGGCERLCHPIAPAFPTDLAKRKVITLVPFCAMKDTDELNFVKGEVLVVDEDLGNGWFWAASEKTNDNGLVYGGLTEDLALCNRSPEKLLYVHTTISRQEAVNLVAKEGLGGYIVTPSESSPGNYTLLVNTGIGSTGIKVERFQIRRKEKTYEIGGRNFDGLHDIITRYSQVSICDDVRLISPVAKNLSTLDNNNLDGDMYKQLRTDRLNSKNSCSDATKCGYLNMKVRKRWKPMYISLKDFDAQLFCYENEKRAKPKIVLDLFSSTLYLVHRSLFNQAYCFELIQSGFDVPFYFSASNAADYEDWISLLRPLCCSNRLYSSPSNSVRKAPSTTVTGASQLRKLNNLTIRIEKAKLSSKSNSHMNAVVLLNGAKICRTAAVECNDVNVIWDEKFVFDNLPHDVNNITVAIKSRAKRSREVKLGSFKINVTCDDESPFTCAEWYDVQNTGPAGWRQFTVGQCHVQINYYKEIVLPLEEYRSLADLIRNESFGLCHCLSSICGESGDRQKLAESLLSYYESDVISMVMAEIRREIEASDNVQMLFRSGNLAVSFVDLIMLREGQDYAVTLLRSAVGNLLTCKITLEIEQSKADKSSNILSNATALLAFTSEICEQIFESAKYFPKALRCLLANVKEYVSKKWPETTLNSLRAISSFVFLRLFCLILALPRQYQLLLDNSPPCGHRNLTLVAKVLQSVANFSDVTAKRESDSVSEALAQSSNQIRPKMAAFLDQISEPVAESWESLVSPRRKSDPARYMATVFHICHKYMEAIRSQEKNYPSVKNLSSVLELLDHHQKRYIGGPTVSAV